MEEILTGMKIGLWIVGIVGGIFGLIWLVFFLAQNNIFFTLAQEGTAKAIKRFGQVVRIIMSYEGHTLDQEKNVIPGTSWNPFGGLRWLGIPFIHSVHTYKFRWTSFAQEKNPETGKIIQVAKNKEEVLDFILVQDDIYFAFVDKAETKGMVPVDVSLLLTIKIINPYKALFRVQDWLEATLNQVVPALREFIGSKQFEDLASAEDLKKAGAEFHGFLSFSEIDEFLRQNYGVDLRKAEMATIDPSGERGEKYVEAASKQWEAEKESQRLATVYGKIQDLGEAGMFIRTLEAIEKASQGQGKLVIFPFGPMQSILRGWMGGGGQTRRGGRGEKKGGNEK